MLTLNLLDIWDIFPNSNVIHVIYTVLLAINELGMDSHSPCYDPTHIYVVVYCVAMCGMFRWMRICTWFYWAFCHWRFYYKYLISPFLHSYSSDIVRIWIWCVCICVLNWLKYQCYFGWVYLNEPGRWDVFIATFNTFSALLWLSNLLLSTFTVPNPYIKGKVLRHMWH